MDAKMFLKVDRLVENKALIVTDLLKKYHLNYDDVNLRPWFYELVADEVRRQERYAKENLRWMSTL